MSERNRGYDASLPTMLLFLTFEGAEAVQSDHLVMVVGDGPVVDSGRFGTPGGDCLRDRRLPGKETQSAMTE